jgi:very-short-patch-repair endonuclease
VSEFKPRPTGRAQELRRSATPAERPLWTCLSRRQVAYTKFSRQIPVGPFICDFVSRSAKLVIELDGGQHDRDEWRDRQRTDYVEGMGYKVIRFWNTEVLESLETVVRRIEVELRTSPPPAPPASGRGAQ